MSRASMTRSAATWLALALLAAGCERQQLWLLPQGQTTAPGDAAADSSHRDVVAAGGGAGAGARPNRPDAGLLAPEPFTWVPCRRDPECYPISCDEGLGWCVECTENANCNTDFGYECHRATRLCARRCASDRDCTDWQSICHRDWKVCVECTNDNHCVGDQEGPLCWKETGRCVQCVDASDCGGPSPGSAICQGGRCFFRH